MSSSEFDLADVVEQAWAGFRGRLADRLAAFQDDECLILEVEVGDDEEGLGGCAPYLQFKGWGGDLVRAEASSNNYLDTSYLLGLTQTEELGALGWSAPTYEPGDEPDSGSANFFTDVERRESDRLAVMTVRALREVFGCLHPSFLSADGLEDDPHAPSAPTPPVEEADDEVIATFPQSPEELHELVASALAGNFSEPLRHDDDGDVPCIVGQSVVYVRVSPNRPAVDLYAEIVLDIVDLARAEEEVGILNREHPVGKFALLGDMVVMTHRIYAWPFAPAQLRVALSTFSDEVDVIARPLAARVGGFRFLDERLAADLADDEAPAPLPALVALLEILYDGPAEPRVVAALFGNDRQELIAQLVRLRTDEDDPGEHDLDLVLGQLRAALRFVAEAEAIPAVRRPLPPRPRRTHQLELLPEAQESFDLEETS